MDRARQIAELRAEHDKVVRQRTDALLEVSAASFNCPRLHDSAHQTPSFRRWLECSERARLIEAEIERIAGESCPRHPPNDRSPGPPTPDSRRSFPVCRGTDRKADAFQAL